MAIVANSNNVAYGIKKFLVDTEAEINTLPTSDTPGSIAFVAATSNKYILNNAKQWVKITGSSSSGGGGNNDGLNPDDTFIWDGGIIS